MNSKGNPSTAKAVGVFFIILLSLSAIISAVTLGIYGQSLTGGLVALATLIVAIILAVKYKKGAYRDAISRLVWTTIIAGVIITVAAIVFVELLIYTFA